jgi:hypothetical protein
MRKRVMRATAIDIGSVDLPENYHKIVLQQNKSRITIRNTSVTADSSIENKQRILMNRLHEFYNDAAHFEQLVTLLEPSSPVSLRLLDWVVTNYSKKNCVFLRVERNGTVETVNLFLDYKAHLKSFSKRSFDPFCRRERIIVTFDIDEKKRKFLTTPAQLNFYKWCIQTGVTEYCQNNLQMLETDMIKNLRVKTDGIRRAEISPCATSVLNRANVSRTVEF